MEATLARPVDFEALLDFCISKSLDVKKGDFILEGFAATSDLDLQSDFITPAAIKASAKDLEKNSTVLDNHDPNKRVGVVLKSESRPGGLWIQVRISETVPIIRKQIEESVINKFSIKGQVIEREIKYDDDGRKIMVIHKMYLTHVAVVSVPANTEARSLRWYIAKALGGEIMPEEKKIEEVKTNNSGKEPEIEKTDTPAETKKPEATDAPKTDTPVEKGKTDEVKPEVEKKDATPAPKVEEKKPEAKVVETAEIAKDDLVLKAEFTAEGLARVLALLNQIPTSLGSPEKVTALIQQIKAMLEKVAGSNAASPFPASNPQSTAKAEDAPKIETAEKKEEIKTEPAASPAQEELASVKKSLGDVVDVVGKMAEVLGEMKSMMPGSSMRKSHIEVGGGKPPEIQKSSTDIMTNLTNAVGEMLRGGK